MKCKYCSETATVVLMKEVPACDFHSEAIQESFWVSVDPINIKFAMKDNIESDYDQDGYTW